VSLSPRIGPEIDASERAEYRLLPDIEDFESARIFRLAAERYRIEYTTREGDKLHRHARGIAAEAYDLTRLHVELVEASLREQASATPDSIAEAESLRGLALRYSALGRYEAASVIAEDLGSRFPDTEAGRWATDLAPRLDRLRTGRRVLIRTGALKQQDGRTELLIFSGYYGLWLGVATPIALEAESRESIAAGLLLGGPAAFYLTSRLTRDTELSRGRAAMIRLGGHLGTWQGLGWAANGDGDGHDIVAAGELAGLAGIAGAVALTHSVNFTEGHAEIASSGLPWGAWFGSVVAVIAGHEDDDAIRDMLIGSDLLVLGAGIAAHGVEASRTRVRLVNLAGVLGGVFGLGIDLLSHVDDEETAIGIAGLGSLAGLGVGVALTSRVDRGRDLSATPEPAAQPEDGALFGFSICPEMGIRGGVLDPRRPMAAIGLRARF
jgi:hypothetical protein